MSSGDYIQDHNESVLNDDGRFDPPDYEDSFDLVKDHIFEETDQRQYEANKALKAALKVFKDSVLAFSKENDISVEDAVLGAVDALLDFNEEVWEQDLKEVKE
jgi:hypothetical protein